MDKFKDELRRTPRWVKVFGIIGIVVVLLVGGLLLFGPDGGHGPGRHTGGDGDPTPTIEHGP